MKIEFSAIEEPPKEMPPKLALPPTTPGASSATELRLCATGRRAISSRVMLVADSVDRTSTRLTTREPITCTASRFTRLPSLPRFTVVVPPSATLTASGLPTSEPSRLTCRL